MTLLKGGQNASSQLSVNAVRGRLQELDLSDVQPAGMDNVYDREREKEVSGEFFWVKY